LCVSISGLGEKKDTIHKPNSVGLAPSRHIEGDTERHSAKLQARQCC